MRKTVTAVAEPPAAHYAINARTKSPGSRFAQTIARLRFDFARTTLWFSRTVLAAAAFVGAFCYAANAAPSLLVQSAPFIISLVLFGLPHGAIDHLVPGRLLRRKLSRSKLAAIIAAYIALAALYLAVWFAVPTAAFVFFILLTWFHWGQGDLYALVRFSRSKYLRTQTQRVLTIIVRGGLPMLIPPIAHPETYRAAATEFVRLFAVAEPSSFARIFAPEFRAAGAGVFAFIAVFSLSLGYRRTADTADRQAWRVEAGETLLLTAYFTILPPVLSIGLYFCFWHSTRHIARLVQFAPEQPDHGGALAKQPIEAAFRSFMRAALPCTVAAFVLLGALFALLPQTTLPALTALYLVLLSALTAPHTVVVSWMDLQEGVWRRHIEQFTDKERLVL